MACGCISKKAAKVTLWIVLPILALSVVVIVLFPTIYNTFLKKEISLQEGTFMTEIWEDIPLPIYEKVHFFNITNKEAFLQGKEPLNVTQVGPYTYKSKWVKNNPKWNSNNTVSYREIRTYHFVPDMSNGTEDDLIYSLNGPMIIASSLVKDYSVILRALLSILLGIEGETIIIKRSIKELAYGGYEDIIIKFAPILKPDIPYKDGTFCWLYGKNATDDGLFTVFTGADDQSKTNFINRWNGKEMLNFWKGDTCNMLNGTSIETGPPIHNYQSSYTFFQSIFCRSIALNYTGDKTHFDILSKRFRPTYSQFANSTENPDNYCFEIEKERPSGILDISSCQFGSPVFISFPHFYMADPFYLNSVNGLNPNDEEHGSHLDVEPSTGCTIHASLKLQINVEISKTEGIFQTYNVTKGIFPILWVDLSLEVDEYFANFFKTKTRNPKIIAYSVLGVLIIVSLILAIVFFAILCLGKSDDDDDEPLLDAVDKECDKMQNSNCCAKNNSYDKVNTSEDCERREESSVHTHKTNLETPQVLRDEQSTLPNGVSKQS